MMGREGKPPQRMNNNTLGQEQAFVYRERGLGDGGFRERGGTCLPRARHGVGVE